MFPIIGRQFTPEQFARYVDSLNLDDSDWKGRFVVLHNTGAPNLSQRPHGFSRQNMFDLQAYYATTQGWNGGPHVFVDDQKAGIWVFNPLTSEGVHSPSWNHRAYGVEMLGDYDVDQFGGAARGQAVRANAVAAVAILSHAAGIDSHNMKLHREDPETTHRNCPGKHVDSGDGVGKADFIARVHDYITAHLIG